MRAILILSLLAWSCGDKDGADTGAPATDDTSSGDDTSAADDTDPGETGETGADDTSSPDDTGETGADDTGETGETAPPEVPLDGMGTISGDCGVLDDELTSANPAFVANQLDLGKVGFDYDQLSAGGQKIYDAGNLGGSSIESEVVAYELLHRCELAALLKTEGEIAYEDDGGKKTDLLVEIDGVNIGVSVTRAYAYPPEDPYTLEQAVDLLEDKLGDVQQSSGNVSDADRWQKQILAVVAYTPDHADQIRDAWDELDGDVRADTILVVTATEGDDESLY